MKELNKILKHHVDKHESEVDPQEIWEGILKKQEPKRRKGWFYLFPLIALVGISFFLFNNLNESGSYTPSSEMTNTPQSSSTQKAEAAAAISEKTINEVKSKKAQVLTNASNTDPKTKALTKSSAPSTTTTSNSITITEANKLNTSIHTLTKYDHASSVETKSVDAHFAIKKEINSQKSFIKNLLTLPVINQNIFDEKELDLQASYTEPSAPIVKNKRWLAIAMTTGSGLVNKSILPSNLLSQEQVAVRQQSETPLEAISGQVQLELGLSKSFSIRSGINYLRLSEKFEWTDTYLSDASGNILSTLQNDNEGNPIVNVTALANPSQLHYSVESKVIHYNTHNFVDVPLTLAYNVRWKKMRASLYGGGALNIMMSSEGKYLNTSSLVEQYGTSNFSSRLSYLAGMNIDVPFCNRLALRAGLNYETRKVQNHGLHARYEAIRADLGLAYRL